nr:immunoglobulin light chain junction region [Macaca mulatta]MPN97752.1 immunoglobulin light chain junction region [Macaca mulatta]
CQQDSNWPQLTF